MVMVWVLKVSDTLVAAVFCVDRIVMHMQRR